MAETSSNPEFEVLVARNLPISNTGRVTLNVVNHNAPRDVVVTIPVSGSALLVPGEYDVIPVLDVISKHPPGSIAHISYDRLRRHFKVEALPKGIRADSQFSVLLNLTDLVLIPT